MTASSFQRYGTPSLVLSDGLVTVPLWAVSGLNLSRRYERAPGTVSTVEDTIMISGLLVGPERFVWRAALETLAEHSHGTGVFRPSGDAGADALAANGGSEIRPVTLLAGSAIHTDLRIVSLSLAEQAMRRDVVEASVTLAHAPEWRGPDLATDVAVAGLSALADWEGHR
ncbi:hypothetical protein ACFYWX_39690 [Streptomyces sp. NPDC002888]|uniref:hypothetical protein n=1 Tax=Streptomyces sp. NPDC002888 TaxID=3364668 RepID=UPI0036BED979